MEFSVVVPTYNRRASLEGLLDRLRDQVRPDEVVVVNGPSTDGTSGMIRQRPDVDILLEVAERNINVARNAGLDAASGTVVALLDPAARPDADWRSAILDDITEGTDMVSATNGFDDGRGSKIPQVDGGNIAMTMEAVRAVDGFDEYLDIGGALDLAERMTAMGGTVEVTPRVRVDYEGVTEPRLGGDGGRTVPFLEDGDSPWGIEYRALAYRTVKNRGIRPKTGCRIARQAIVDGFAVTKAVLGGDVEPTTWFGNGWSVTKNSLLGARDGLLARWRDRTVARNPNGISMRRDRVVERVDLRER